MNSNPWKQKGENLRGSFNTYHPGDLVRWSTTSHVLQSPCKRLQRACVRMEENEDNSGPLEGWYHPTERTVYKQKHDSKHP